MNNELKAASESEPAVDMNVPGEILMFCNEASDDMRILNDAYEALNSQFDRLDPLSEKEVPSDGMLAIEILIARTLMGLFAEKTKNLGRLVSDRRAKLKKILKDIEED